jgi:drug/metabolite transporter (DMT)-like permease
LELGIALALACAVMTQVGFLCRHRGANLAPAVEWRRPAASIAALFRSRWFALGMGVAAAAWALHAAAMTLAPLSTVQVVLSSGVVFVAVLGSRVFGCAVPPRQWVGVLMTAAGMVVLLATLPHAGEDSRVTSSGFLAFEGAMLGLGVLLVASPRLGAPTQHHGTALGAAAGTLFGVSDVAVKAMTGALGDGPLALLATPWLPVAVSASLLAFLASARGFQTGAAVPVIASMGTAANLTAILGGILVFGDALSADALVIAVQVLAFALVTGAAFVAPAGHGPAPAPAAA